MGTECCRVGLNGNARERRAEWVGVSGWEGGSFACQQVFIHTKIKERKSDWSDKPDFCEEPIIKFSPMKNWLVGETRREGGRETYYLSSLDVRA